MSSSGLKLDRRHALGIALAIVGAWTRPAAAGSILNFTGAVYDAAGATGTSTEAPSFAGAVVYDSNLSAIKATYPLNTNPTAISPAAGGQPATFAYDVQNLFSQQGAAISAGDTLVAVAETRQGIFGWASATASVWYIRHLLTTSEFNAQVVSASGNQVPIPAPTLVTATSSTVQLSWSGMPDPTGALSSYTVYRATYLPNPATATLPVGDSLTAVAQAGTVNFTDSTVAPNTTYHYTLAANFVWDHPSTPTASLNLGAYGSGGTDYYTTFGQGYPVTVTTALNPAHLTAQWVVPVGATTNQYFTAVFNVSNTGDVTSTGNVTPNSSGSLVITSTGSQTVLAGPSPLSAPVAPHATVGFTYTISPTSNGVMSFSATAVDGAGLSATAGSSAVSVSPAAVLSSSLSLNRSLIYLTGTASPAVTTVIMVMTVTNVGGGIANGVSPAAQPTEFDVSGTGPLVSLQSGPAAAVSLSPGAAASFTWVYGGAASGIANFQVHAAGTDANTGQPLSYFASPSRNLVVASNGLSLSWNPGLSGVYQNYSLGENVTATVQVVNNSTVTTAFGTSPTAGLVAGRLGSIQSGAPVVDIVSGPTPAQAAIAANGNLQLYNFVFGTLATGAFRLGTHALATGTAGVLLADDASNYAQGALASPLTVVTPASLSVSALVASASQVTIGQIITVTMNVADVGEDTATAVAPAVTLTASGGAQLVLVSAPASAGLRSSAL